MGTTQRGGAGDGGAVLVIGAGFLGAAICARLLRTGRHVTAVSRSEPGGRRAELLAGAELLVGDAADRSVLDGPLEEAAAIVFCAGGSPPADADADPTGEVDGFVAPALAVLDALGERPGKQLLLISSGGTVYGEPVGGRADERHPLAPRGSYAIGRVTVERRLADHRRRNGLRATALRCANAYGEGQIAYRSQGVVATLLAALAEGRSFPLYGDGRAVRDYVHVEDVAAVVERLLGRPDLPVALNVGTGIGTSTIELVALAGEITGRRVEVERLPARGSDLRQVVLDISRLRSLLPFEPLGLSAGLTRTWSALGAAVG